MRQFVHDSQGWTLAEMLIMASMVVILAGIAIPLFADERLKAFNSAAESDVRNLKTAEEILRMDYMTYGTTEIGTLPGSGGTKGAGVELAGPLDAAKEAHDSGTWRKRDGASKSPSTGTVGALISGTDKNGVAKGIGVVVGQGVFVQADISPNGDSYIVYGRHQQGNRAYAAEADISSILVCENDVWVNQKGVLAKRAPEVSSEYDDLPDEDCGGKQLAKWTTQ